MKPLKIGPRILKTGVSVAMAIYLSTILIPESGGVLAGIAALNSTLPSLKKSYESLISRMLGTIIGAVVSVGMVYFFQATPLPDSIQIGIACIVTITVLNLLNLSDVISLVVVAVIAIMLNNSDQFLISAINRVIDTFIGVLVAFFINWLLFPPKYDVNFVAIMEHLNSEILILIRASLRRNADFALTHRDLKWSQKTLSKLDNYYQLVKNELVIGTNKRVNLARKLVIFRQLRTVLNQSILLLDVLHHNGNLFNQIPDDLRIMIRERTEVLLGAHEQIILKLSGKVPPEKVNFMEITPEYREYYLNNFHNQIMEWRNDYGPFSSKSNEVIKLMSRIYQYEHSLKTLNRLMRTYKKYHEKGYINEFDHSITEHLTI